MKVLAFILTAPWVALVAAEGRPFVLTFTSSPSVTQGIVAGNFAYYNGTNDYRNTYVGCCSAVSTNIYFDSTNIVVNPCYLYIQTSGTNGLKSANSEMFLFDTNNYPTPVTNAPTAIIIQPATGLNAAPQ